MWRSLGAQHFKLLSGFGVCFAGFAARGVQKINCQECVLRALLNRHAVKMENEFSYALIRETRKTTGKCFHLFLANINTSLGLPVVCFTTLTWILFEYSADNALTSSGANPWLSRKMRNVTLPL